MTDITRHNYIDLISDEVDVDFVIFDSVDLYFDTDLFFHLRETFYDFATQFNANKYRIMNILTDLNLSWNF